MSEGRNVVAITGATSGIGRAIAIHVADCGWDVEIAGRSGSRGSEVVEQISAAGGDARFTSVDVCDQAAVRGWITDIWARRGRLDGLVNNAGLNGRATRMEDYADDEFETIVTTNLMAAYYTAHAVIPLMREAGGGAIVNIGSTASLQGYGMLSGYTASKHGLLGLTRSIALENADVPIRANCVCPGPVDTPLMREIEERMSPDDPSAARDALTATTALKRYGEPTEIAQVVGFLLGSASSYVTGTAVSVDGGVMTGV
jgi:meso-butanediol dehydrogenase/(S,S)-butanediol dehydrogenase/diacetyl reductase